MDIQKVYEVVDHGYTITLILFDDRVEFLLYPCRDKNYEMLAIRFDVDNYYHSVISRKTICNATTKIMDIDNFYDFWKNNLQNNKTSLIVGWYHKLIARGFDVVFQDGCRIETLLELSNFYKRKTTHELLSKGIEDKLISVSEQPLKMIDNINNEYGIIDDFIHKIEKRKNIEKQKRFVTNDSEYIMYTKRNDESSEIIVMGWDVEIAYKILVPIDVGEWWIGSADLDSIKVDVPFLKFSGKYFELILKQIPRKTPENMINGHGFRNQNDFTEKFRNKFVDAKTGNIEYGEINPDPETIKLWRKCTYMAIMLNKVNYGISFELGEKLKIVILPLDDDYCYSVDIEEKEEVLESFYKHCIESIDDFGVNIGRPSLRLTSARKQLILKSLYRTLNRGCCCRKYCCRDFTTEMMRNFACLKNPKCNLDLPCPLKYRSRYE